MIPIRLHVRLAIPFVLVAGVIGVVVTGVTVWLVGRTSEAALVQAARQLGRISEHEILLEGRDLPETAEVLAMLDGPARARVAVWGKRLPDAVLVMEGAGDQRTSAWGRPVTLRDPAGMVGAVSPGGKASRVAVVELADGWAVAAAAARPRRGTVVVVNRLNEAFLARLAGLLQAEIRLERGVEGGPRADPVAAAARRELEVRHVLAVPGGRTAVLVMRIPGNEYTRARRSAIAVGWATGAGVLVVGLLVSFRILRGVTEPIEALTRATEELTTERRSTELPRNAPAELGVLVSRFRAMRESLEESRERLVHSARLSTVGQFIAGISHELSNPIVILTSHAEQMDSRLPADVPGRDNLAVIRAQAVRLRRLLADLRGFVRRDGGVREAVDLRQLVRETVALVRHDAEAVGVRCEYHETAEPVRAECVPDQIRQVLLNLVLNALQAMPAGGRLTAETEIAAANGHAHRVRVLIRDTGAGIPEKDLAAVFEPFFTTKPGRLGLGLAICRDILSTHGGDLRLSRAEGGGTEAVMVLPS